MPPRSVTRQTTRLRDERTIRIIEGLRDSIEFITQRIAYFYRHINDFPDALGGIQDMVRRRDVLQARLNVYMIRLVGYLP